MAQPSTRPNELRNLDKVNPANLTDQFANDKDILLSEALEKALTKSLQSKELTASALGSLLEAMIKEMNKDDTINFSKIWRRYI